MHTKRLVIILMIGIGLLLFPSLVSKESETDIKTSQEIVVINRADYEKELEKRLASILSTLQDVSRVSVMITLSDNGKAFYARDEQADKKTVTDGTLNESSLQTGDAPILKNDRGGGQSPILIKTDTPKISGVLVAAKGVGNPSVQANVIKAVQAVLDVAPHRIQVLEKS